MVPPPQRIIISRSIAFCLSLAVAVLGISVLTGWAFDIGWLKSVLPGLVTMKANTALGTFFCGAALALLSRKEIANRSRFAVTTMGWFVLAMSALTLGEYLFGWELGIDQLLFHDLPGAVGTSQPGRMSPATAFCFVLMACALLVAARRSTMRLRLPIMAALGMAVIVVGGLALVGYVSETLFGSRWWNYTGMAVHTAAGFSTLGVVLLALVKSEGGLTWSLDKNLTAGFVGAIAVMLIAAAVTYNLIDKMVDASKWVAHTQEVLKEVKEIAAGMAELESDQRGYIITGDERVLSGREGTRAGVRQDIADIRKLTADNLSQQHRLDQLEPLIAQRTDFGDQTIVARRQEDFAAAEKMIATGTGIGLSEKVQGLLKEMENEEYRLLDQRQTVSTNASTAAFLVLPLGIFLSLAMLSVGLFILNAGVGERQQAEEALRKNEAQLKTVIENLGEGVVVSDLTGQILHFNRAALAMHGFASLDEIRLHLREFADIFVLSSLDGTVLPIEQWPLARILRGEKLHEWEVHIRRKESDRQRVFSYGGTLVLEPSGKPLLAVVTISDITARKHDEEARTRLAAIVEFSGDAIIGKDLHSTVTSWNNGAQKIFGYSANEMVGRSITQLIPPDRQGEEEEILERIRHGESVEHFETVRITKDGTPLNVSVTVSPIKDEAGTVLGASKIVRDVTERKQAEAKIHELNVTLEQRVAERTAQLEAANKELEAFSYSVSHDLRTPLRAVDGFSQAVEEDYGPQLPEEGRRYLRTIREGAQRMGTLIDDLLAFSRLSRQPVNKQLVDTGKLVRDILEELNPRQQGRQVEIHIGNLPSCQGDAALLKQVWVNLLSNALKYTRKRESAVIEIGCVQEQGTNTYFVRDNGSGFDMKYAHKLFGVFQRLHRVEDYEGTGVGLAIVQRIIHRHGGRIWAEAALERGATFHFTLEGDTKS
jgi:PAS domain S-box-containing protein